MCLGEFSGSFNYLLFCLYYLLIIDNNVLCSNDNPYSTEAWMMDGQAWLQTQLDQFPLGERRPAKNAILFVGDGMGITSLTAARIYKTQKALAARSKKMKENGEEVVAFTSQIPLVWEQFPGAGLVKTYSASHHVTDSGAAITALLSGTKAQNSAVGVGPEVTKDDCTNALLNTIRSMANWCQARTKHVGFVTTTSVTHATPAGMYANTPNRFWESDADMPCGIQCKDTARQLVENSPGVHLRVILGGGRSRMYSNNTADVDGCGNGRRLDDRDLVQDWSEQGGTRRYVTNKKQLDQVNLTRTDFLMGLFAPDELKFEIDRNKTKGKRSAENDGNYGNEQPSLTEMMETAIKMLQKGPEGYFLLVEGGRIDQAFHHNRAKAGLEEILELERAVLRAKELTKGTNTLLVLTSDHSHGLTLNGYPRNNESIFESNEFQQSTFIKRRSAVHTGEDVPVYADGSHYYLFSGVIENHWIAHGLAYALCVGPSRQLCLKHRSALPRHGWMQSLSLEALLIGSVVIIGALTLLLFVLLMLICMLRRK